MYDGVEAVALGMNFFQVNIQAPGPKVVLGHNRQLEAVFAEPARVAVLSPGHAIVLASYPHPSAHNTRPQAGIPAKDLARGLLLPTLTRCSLTHPSAHAHPSTGRHPRR